VPFIPGLELNPVQPADLDYPRVLELLPAYQRKGLSESAAFLNWFLENIYRLDDTTAQDSICDAPNDKGIDGIYVDHAEQEVLFFQSKLRQTQRLAWAIPTSRNLSGRSLSSNPALRSKPC
jgi:hypothetical protein